jgi:hypothetical protein
LRHRRVGEFVELVTDYADGAIQLIQRKLVKSPLSFEMLHFGGQPLAPIQ